MGLFSKKQCVKCGKECGVFGRTTTKDDKVLCSDCAKLAGNEFDSFEHTYEQYLVLVDRYNENEKKLQEFTIDKVYYDRIFIDTSKNWIAITEDSLFKKENMYKKHPHIYDAKDLKFFVQEFDVKKQETSIVGTNVYIDFSTTMVFDDEFVPCPVNGVVEENRRVEVKGVFKKRTEGFYKQGDLELFNFANDILKAKGLERPRQMQKGDTVESLDNYAQWFKMVFDLEKKGIIKSKKVNCLLENLTENLGILGSTKMPSQIRKRFDV